MLSCRTEEVKRGYWQHVLLLAAELADAIFILGPIVQHAFTDDQIQSCYTLRDRNMFRRQLSRQRGNTHCFDKTVKTRTTGEIGHRRRPRVDTQLIRCGELIEPYLTS
jgi:hypothetical protein